MRKLAACLVVGMGITVLVAPAGPARANVCISDARSTFSQCKDTCKTDFLDDKASCLGIDTGCFLACRDGRRECVQSAEEPLTSCLETCKGPLRTARTNCKATCSCGDPNVPDDGCGFNPCFISCIDPAQSAAFECRDNCRDQFKLDANAQATLAACRTGFQSCLASCPPR